MMPTETMRFTAVGDFLTQRKLAEPYEGMEEIAAFIRRGDVRFFNLETTFPTRECYGNQYYGGTPLRAEASVLEDAKAFGFNIANLANNHTMDYCHEGACCTLDAVKAAGFPCAGVGYNLDEAAAPAYIETRRGNAGLVGVVSSMQNVAAMAGRQSRRVPGRPGVNGLRIDEKVVVTPEDFAAIERIANGCPVNAQLNISRSEGFTPALPDGVLPIKTVLFERGTETKYVTHPNETDMRRIEQSVGDAAVSSEYVLVSMHSHEVGAVSKEVPGDFYREFAHRCIDAGAHAVLGHGPHLLRPVEIYHGRPIFYSLGNFLFQEEMTPFLHEDMFEKYNLTSDSSMKNLYNTRTKDHTRGLMEDRRVYEAIIPYFEMQDGKLTKLELLPISLGFELPRCRMGLPRTGFHRGILERLAAMSAPYGTEIAIREDGMGEVKLV